MHKDVKIIKDGEHIRHVKYPDGSEGFAAKTEEGVTQLTLMADEPKYKSYRRLTYADQVTVHALLEK